MSHERDDIPGTTSKAQSMIVEQMYRELLGSPVLENPDTPIYHYTSVANFEKILASKTIWATDYRQLKDAREFAVGDELVLDVIKAAAVDQLLSTPLRGFFEALVQNYERLSYTKLLDAVFVASFCEHADDASQWREFGVRGDGVCVGLSWRPSDVILDTGHRIGATMLKVRYDKTELRQTIKDRLIFVGSGCLRYLETFPHDGDPISKHGLLIASRSLAYLIPAIKQTAYRAEAERRIIALPVSGAPLGVIRTMDDGRQYVRIPLTPDDQTPIVLHEVIVGSAGNAQHRLDNVREILRSFGYSVTIARQSEIRER